ncbi:RagB/SusD family nutrient uptake outer membrane protein [Echinicola soli]|uniref:RagB/SusD family nutrient uptake outer membrane protein n=1 Tax=Echinicola soli TaxID=2591634 RepID=A0A514CN25_9BACT|nr:RagB/SusD family nutrient uptake outer membrane protein [Echinicola soli]QDH81216.1 RagB/SusD family nutrient uptake outer membrane protein [Echinicola soli]
MKTIYNLATSVVSLTLLLIVSSCSNDYFDRFPTDEPTENTFFTDQASIEQMLNDGYVTLRDAYEYYYVIGDLASDDVYNSKFNNSSDHITINESNVVADNGIISNLWNSAYATISRTNLVLENIDKVSMSDSVRNQYANEAKFLRGLMYFNLVRIYGDVPLVLEDVKTQEEALSYGREAVANVYDQIIADFTDAEKLPAFYTDNADIGRATRYAAKGMLAKVYLTLKRYSEANAKLEQVMASPPTGNANAYHLLTSYADVFDAANPNNAEIIFAVQFARGFTPSQGNPFVQGAMANEDIGTGVLKRGTGTFLMTEDLAASFPNSDKRRGMFSRLDGSRRSYVFTTKYYDEGMVSTVDAGNDWIVLRYADINLMYAEVQNEMGDPGAAYPFLQAVRTRAGLATDENLKTDQAAMRLAIEQERRLELFCEGHRWFDLSRTDRLLTVMNSHFQSDLSNDEIGTDNMVQDYELIFPIPRFQVNLNPENIDQNDQY